MKDAYQRLRDSVCASRVVHTDDTGWRGRIPDGFETDETAVYQVCARHRNEEVREVVLSEFGESALPCILLGLGIIASLYSLPLNGGS